MTSYFQKKSTLATDHRVVQRIYNAPFSYVSHNEAPLSLVKNWTKNPLMMLKVLSWPLIMSPSDQFLAANGCRNVSVLLTCSGRD